ncbi:MAG: efflux RND transporter periplasmic adaptor subunit [Armatimonadetes bacterium]|nr:efflux RND transporter periplasmic adaptor subunit [Armatimonadota bacterium]
MGTTPPAPEPNRQEPPSVSGSPLGRAALVAIGLVALAVTLTGCGGPKMDKAAADSTAPKGQSVTVAPAVSGTISKTVDVTGKLIALQDVTVGSRMAGKVASVNVREGDRVQAGQIVAAMDVEDYRPQKDSMQANLEAALTRQAQAEGLAEQAANQVKQAETNLELTDRGTQAGLEVARAALASAQQSLSAVRQGARAQEREQAEQQVRAARANLTKAVADLKRMEALASDQAVSASQVDQARAAHDGAEAAYRAASEALSLVKEGARKEDVRRAELAVDQAKEGLKKAEADRDMVALRRTDVANAEVGLRSARSGVEAAIMAVRQSRAAVALATNNLSGAYVRSPISGFVAARLAEPGQQVGSGAPIIRIVAPGSVYLEASLSETLYADISVGLPVDVTVDAVPGLKLKGRVTRIMPVASSAARSFTLRVDFPSDPRLRPEMFARGAVVVGEHRSATLVNKDAVMFGAGDDGGTVLVVGPDSRAVLRKVSIGYSDPRNVEVLSGLKPGDPVIVAGQTALQDGDPVTVTNPEAIGLPGGGGTPALRSGPR